MSSFPVISGQECVTVLAKVGFYVKRQRGSHIILRRDNPFGQITVPNHKTLDRGTLRFIIRSADISVEQFIKLL